MAGHRAAAGLQAGPDRERLRDASLEERRVDSGRGRVGLAALDIVGRMRAEPMAATLGDRKKEPPLRVVVPQERRAEAAPTSHPEHRGAEAERFSTARKQCLAWQQTGPQAAQPQERRRVLLLPHEDARPRLALLLQE